MFDRCDSYRSVDLKQRSLTWSILSHLEYEKQIFRVYMGHNKRNFQMFQLLMLYLLAMVKHHSIR